MQAARGASLNSGDHEPDASDDTVSRAATEPEVESRRRRRRLRGIFLLLALGCYAVDLATKIIAVDALAGRGAVDMLGPYLRLYLVRNPGAAFSTGTSFTVVLTLIAIVAACVVIYLSRRIGSVPWAVGLGALLGGVLGNLTDRIFRAPGPFEGHVVDFLALPNWPVFNFADIWINVAAGVIILQAVRGIRIDGTRHADSTHEGTTTDPDRTGA